MYISELALTNFRSYAFAHLHIERGITALVGENGQGKTNIVEAIGYLATLGSHRISHDYALVRQGESASLIGAKVERGDTSTSVELTIQASGANRAQLNRGKVRPGQILGNVKSVLFAPEDLGLVRGDPSGRRNFLGSILVQLRPRLASVLSEYDKVARQRAAALKAAGKVRRNGGSVDEAMLAIFDEQLARLGAHITAARAGVISALRPHVAEYYANISGGASLARIDYHAAATSAYRREHRHLAPSSELGEVSEEERLLLDANWVEQRFLTRMGELREAEMERGVNLVGPHRDDLALNLGSLPAKGYCSHGEAWSYALALRLASWKLLTEDASGHWAENEEPILILDDVFAELDSKRRAYLSSIVTQAEQVFITAAVGTDIPEELTYYTVRVQRDEEGLSHIYPEDSQAGVTFEAGDLDQRSEVGESDAEG